MAMWSLSRVLLPKFLIIVSLACFLEAESDFGSYFKTGSYDITAQFSTSWTINQSKPSSFGLGSFLHQVVLLNQAGFACGFYSPDGKNDSFFSSVGFANPSINWSGKQDLCLGDVVWLANRNRPVGSGATLESDRFRESGHRCRSERSSRMSRVGIRYRSARSSRMYNAGAMTAYDDSNSTVWQSFDYPAEALIRGQEQVPGQKLVASVSTVNKPEGIFYLYPTPDGLFAFYQANDPPQVYFKHSVSQSAERFEVNYSSSGNGTLALHIVSGDEPETVTTGPMKCLRTSYRNCGCFVALFRPNYNFLQGDCHLPLPLLSLLSDRRRQRDNFLSFAIFKIENGSVSQDVMIRKVMNMAKEDQLIDVVDKESEDMQLHKSEAVQMMKIAIWCLQSDFTKRPSMSRVVMALEGRLEVDADLDYSIQNPTRMVPPVRREAFPNISSEVLPSILSAP
ncbi:hypothetical protein Tsubulata_009825, partial [Turnera subulata]